MRRETRLLWSGSGGTSSQRGEAKNIIFLGAKSIKVVTLSTFCVEPPREPERVPIEQEGRKETRGSSKRLEASSGLGGGRETLIIARHSLDFP